MKRLHRPDLFAWSAFDEARNIDFNSVVWVRPTGNVVFDPLPMSEHDRAHLDSLGQVAWIVVTNSDHLRATDELALATGALVAGPAGERGQLDLPVSRWLADGDELVPGLQTVALSGSKTPGELAMVLDQTTLLTGDLIRAHVPGELMILPDPKLQDKTAACASLRRLADLPGITAVLVGDGWPIFRDGQARLQDLAVRLGV